MSKILGIREKELHVLRKGSIVGAVSYIMWFCSSFIVSFSFYIVYINFFITCKISVLVCLHCKVLTSMS